MMTLQTEIAVVGAGHAGCEAAVAASRMGMDTLLFTMHTERIAWMPCNPSIGGIGKGHLVKEIDALGGIMGDIIDKTGTQFRILNQRKGPAVQAIRAQADKYQYMLHMRKLLDQINGLTIHEGKICDLEELPRERFKLHLQSGETCIAHAVIFCLGTFLKGLIHVGMESFKGGRIDEDGADDLLNSFKRLGIKTGRLKTGTTPRLDKRTIDFSRLQKQYGDIPVPRFSYRTDTDPDNHEICYMTYTNEHTHQVIRENLDQSPLYRGKITGIGPRYCPSIEDKVIKFKDKNKHQIFLEPEGDGHLEVYPNGISTSLPLHVQRKMIRTIESLEQAEIVQPGYAVEYNFIFPEQLNRCLHLHGKQNMFFAGQLNGTSGYEEAAAQGLIAGVNAVLLLKKEPPLVLHREEAYMGVMVDDIIHKRIREPYRIFTSRAERRLYLRNDNADRRLMEKGRRLSLINDDLWKKRKQKWDLMDTCRNILKTQKIMVGDTVETRKTISLHEYCKRPLVTPDQIHELVQQHTMDEEVLHNTIIEIKYEGYIKKEKDLWEANKKLEHIKLPGDIKYEHIQGLTKEEQERMNEFKPKNLREAEIYCGLRPGSIDQLLFYVKHLKNKGVLSG